MNAKMITVESFIDLAWYNGLIEECQKLYIYIRDESKKGLIVKFPEWMNPYDCNHLLRVFWSILSIEYGEYGSSPRYGWLESENVGLFLDKFKECLESFDLEVENEQRKSERD